MRQILRSGPWAVLAVAALRTATAGAATVTVGGITFEGTAGIDQATLAPGSPNIIGNAGLAHNNGTYAAAGTNTAHSTWALAGGGFSGESTFLAPDGTARGGLRLGWTGRVLRDLPGNDFVIAENGGAGRPEYFVVRVKPAGGALTGFFFKPAGEFLDAGAGNGEFLTAFDLAVDFGLPAGTDVEFVEVWNLTTVDQVAGAGGTGFLGGTFAPSAGTLDTDATPGVIDSGQYDADVAYLWAVGADNLVPVPEPATLTAAVLVGGLVLAQRRTAARRRRADAQRPRQA